MITTDLAAPTTGTLARISDARAIQYWDPDRSVSAYLVSIARANPGQVSPQQRERLLGDGFIVWDAALVFPAGSHWESTLPPPSFSGGPVVDELDAIRVAFSAR